MGPIMPANELQPDFYDLLGIGPAASSEEIRKRYRFLVMAFHPDRFSRNPEHHALAEQRIKQVNEAYRVLSDPQARTRYDMVRVSSMLGPKTTAYSSQFVHLQRELDQVRSRSHQLEQDVYVLRTAQEALLAERATLQRELEDRERSYRTERQTLEAEAKLLTMQLEQLARERTNLDQLLKDQLAQANSKAAQLSQELASRERLVENLAANKADWERSNQSRLELLSQQMRRLQEELAARDASLAQQRQVHSVLEERLVRVEHDAHQAAQHLANALRIKQQEADVLQTGVRVAEESKRRETRANRLWQIAALVGIVNTVVLLLLLFTR
jgi:curved DNA-binding protein CbpA